MVLPKAGLKGFDWTFVQSSTIVLQLNYCAKNPPHCQAKTFGSHSKTTQPTRIIDRE